MTTALPFDTARLLDELDDAILVVAANGIVRYANAAARRMDEFGAIAPGRAIATVLAALLEQEPAEAEALDATLADVSAGRCQRAEEDRCRRGADEAHRVTIVATAIEVDGDRGLVLQLRELPRRTEAELAVRESEARWRSLVDGSPDIVFITDASSRMIYANHALERQTGYTAADFQRPQAQNSLVHPDDQAPLARRIAEFVGSERRYSERLENRFVTKWGEVLWYSSVIAKTTYRGRPALQFVVHNVTAERRAIDESERRRREAEDAVRLRDDFLSVAAHELKTPITSLNGHAALIGGALDRGDAVDPSRLRRSLAAIVQQSARLARLVEQLLDVSRIEGGQLRLGAREPTELRSLVESVVAAAPRRKDVHVEVSADGVALVDVDPLRFEQVVANLVDNAVKFSEPAGVVRVDIVSSDERAIEVVFENRGEEVPPDQQRQLFARFFRGRNAGGVAGLGLGLFVSRRIVELHGGTLSAELPGDGVTRFRIRLPRVREEASP